MSETKTIDLLRHGETTAGRCFIGATDKPLSERGWQQMQCTMQGREYEAILSSPLQRCYAFAEHFSQQTPLDVIEDLREINFGDWELQTSEQLWQREPQNISAFWDNPDNYTPPNAESFGAFKSRVEQAWAQAVIEHNAQQLLVVAHAGVIRQILAQVLELNWQQALKIQLDFAGLTRLQFEQGYSRVQFINSQHGIAG